MRELLQQLAGEMKEQAHDLERLAEGSDPLPAMLLAQALVECERLRADLARVLLGLQVAAGRRAPP